MPIFPYVYQDAFHEMMRRAFPEHIWNQGYPSEDPYICAAHRELAPNWIDAAALMQGIRPARRREGDAFRYLDLGCGMGYGLCLLAALYPEGQFLGVDFIPDHRSHGEDLRRRLKLSNLTFLEGDFLALAEDPLSLGKFEYVVSHGIATWVVEPVQQALFSLASSTLSHGGIYYCSANSLPGWTIGSILQAMVTLERRRADISDPMTTMKRAIETLQKLLGSREQLSALAITHPSLGRYLERLSSLPPSYLVQEYACAGWQPLYAWQFHERCGRHKLTYVGTATIGDLRLDLLPKELQSGFRNEEDSLIRETLIDLAINRSFRRDLFMRGRLPLSASEQQHGLESLTIRIQEPAKSSLPYRFNTSLGIFDCDQELYEPIELALEDGPQTLGALAARLNYTLSQIKDMVALLLHAGRVGLDRGSATTAAQRECNRIVPLLHELILNGRPYESLPAPTLGNTVSLNVGEALSLRALIDGLEDEMAATCVMLGLGELNRGIQDPETGKLVADTVQASQVILKLVQAMRTNRLPALQRLGILEALRSAPPASTPTP